MEVGVRKWMMRDSGGGVRRETTGRRDFQHVFVVVGEGRDKVGVGACREGGGQCRLLAVHWVRPLIRAIQLGGLKLGLQLSLGASPINKVQPTTETVHTLTHVVQRHRKPK